MVSFLSASDLSHTDMYVLEESFISNPLLLTRSKKRKRTNLDGFSPFQKEERRKVLNRVAAQQSRDRKKQLMTNLERRTQELATENALLKRQNDELSKKHFAAEKRYEQLLEKFNRISKSTESAELLFPPQRVICLILLFLALNLSVYRQSGNSFASSSSSLMTIQISVPIVWRHILPARQLHHQSLSRIFMESPIT